MKILHTSDWHLGSTWESIDRSEDLLSRAVPDVVEIALKEKVDIVLVTGDIFEPARHLKKQRRHYGNLSENCLMPTLM